MRTWPSPEDRTPSQTAFWVQSKDGGIIRTAPVSESPQAVERRLEADFPLYRIKRFGENILSKVVKQRNRADEV